MCIIDYDWRDPDVKRFFSWDLGFDLPVPSLVEFLAWRENWISYNLKRDRYKDENGEVFFLRNKVENLPFEPGFIAMLEMLKDYSGTRKTELKQG